MFVILIDVIIEIFLYFTSNLFSYFLVILQYLFNSENGRLIWLIILFSFLTFYRKLKTNFFFCLLLFTNMGFELSLEFITTLIKQSPEMILVVSLLNGYMLIHPLLLYTSFLIAFFYYYFWLSTSYKYKLKLLTLLIFFKKFYHVVIKTLYIFLLALLTGALWSVQETGWSGFWAWDFVELVPLFMFFLSVFLLHFFILLKFFNILLFFFIFITFYFFINFIQLNPDSAHNFFGIPTFSESQVDFSFFLKESIVTYNFTKVLPVLNFLNFATEFDAYTLFTIVAIYNEAILTYLIVFILKQFFFNFFFYRDKLVFLNYLLLLFFFLSIYYSFFSTLIFNQKKDCELNYLIIYFIYFIYFKLSKTSIFLIFLLYTLYYINFSIFFFFLINRRLRSLISKIVHIIVGLVFIHIYSTYVSFFDFYPKTFTEQYNTVISSIKTNYWLLVSFYFNYENSLFLSSIQHFFFVNFFFFNFFLENFKFLEIIFFKILSFSNFSIFNYTHLNSFLILSYTFYYNHGQYIWNFLFFFLILIYLIF